MKITVIQIGKTKASYFSEAEREYVKRLKPYAEIRTITLKEGPVATSNSEREITKKKEAEEIGKHLEKGNYVISLTEKGKSFTSEKFAQLLEKNKNFEGGVITFIIGGPYGLADSIFQKAHLQLSFSAFTFTHEMIRVLLLEQLYRGFTIMTGKTYHY